MAKITIKSTIHAPIEKVWEYWTGAQHIVNWNFASDDWHCPRAENDLRVGGKLQSRMESKDGTMGFDFEATYDEIIEHTKIAYTMPDGRHVVTDFKQGEDGTHITTTFDAEDQNSIEMQRGGWLAILDNFKRYTERTA